MASLFLLIAAVVLRRSGVGPMMAPEQIGAAWLTLLTLAGSVGVGLLSLVVGWLPWNRPARGHRAWSRSARRTRWVGAFACAWIAFCVLGLGWFDLVRERIGDWVLLDETLAIAPAIVAMFIAWWAHEPFARQHAPPRARAGFVLTQARVLLPLLLIPVGAVLAAQELVERFVRPVGEAGELLGVSAAIAALLLAPALVVPALSTSPLPAGSPLGARIRALFADHRIRLRSVRVWRTDFTLMNGVALGLLPWCRWVLLTDALIEGLAEDEALAVAGHEAGHLRHRHAAWLAGACIGGIGCTSVAIGALLDWFSPVLPAAAWVEWTAMALLILVTLGFFGVVSRTCERQADAFAARSMSPGAEIAADAAHALRRALAIVAYSNGISPRRPSFRHGSIESRRRRLAMLVGAPINALPIDRDMRNMKVLIAAALLVTAAAAVFESIGRPTPVEMEPVVLTASDAHVDRMIAATETRP